MRIVLHEVGPRDGLQAEKTVVDTGTKIRWVERLIAAGIDIIQVGSFVHPTKVPQMADTEVLFRWFQAPERKPRATVLSALVLNERGLERGFACGVDMFCMGVSASETHSLRNTGMGIEEATRRILAMGAKAMGEGKGVQLSVQSAFGCGHEGKIEPGKVLALVRRFIEAGFTRISLADTAGFAHPAQVEYLFGSLREMDPELECACHFHDTWGLGMANVWAALKSGVTYFESSFAGLGGCPFTAITSGNVCTEDLVHMFHLTGLLPHVDVGPILEVSRDAEALFGRALPGRLLRTGPMKVAEASASGSGVVRDPA
jgi:hydroxymethylglutaryl-CoA lyase